MKLRKAYIKQPAPTLWPEPRCDFDIDDQGTWPNALWELYGQALAGLHNGDLAPLHRYIISGFPLSRGLVQSLALMIEGHPDLPFSLAAVGRKRGQLTPNERRAEEDLHLRVGLFAEKRLRASERGNFEAIVAETMSRFCVGRTKVTNAIKSARQYIAANEARMPGALEAMCEIWSVD